MAVKEYRIIWLGLILMFLFSSCKTTEIVRTEYVVDSVEVSFYKEQLKIKDSQLSEYKKQIKEVETNQSETLIERFDTINNVIERIVIVNKESKEKSSEEYKEVFNFMLNEYDKLLEEYDHMISQNAELISETKKKPSKNNLVYLLFPLGLIIGLFLRFKSS